MPEPDDQWTIDLAHLLEPHFIDRCCCGHDSIDHVRVYHSDFPCVVCACIDHEPVLSDDETVADILILLAT